MTPDILIRNAEVNGRPGQDVRLSAGRIQEIGEGLTGGGEEIDARGGALIVGLIDHHIHLLATAAQAGSLTLDDIDSPEAFAARLRQGLGSLPCGTWLRAVGYHDVAAGLLSRDDLDRLAPDHPVRLQDRTGALWILNSRALALVEGGELPPTVERDADGRLTGRIWRGDAWLQSWIGRTPPPLGPIGAALAGYGVTGAMDASATTDADSALVLADAVRSGDLPLRLRLMSAGPLRAPEDAAFAVGPLKILLDDRDLPPIDELVARIAGARGAGRKVAVHCVTAAELAVTLASFDAAGARPGDRIEHGGMIPARAIDDIARLGLTVVTQPGFVFERGERYLAEIEREEHQDLCRAASLRAAGIPLAASSDAPYGPLDPWTAMRAAVSRSTRAGRPLGPAEGVTPEDALALYQGGFARPGGDVRRVAVGEEADLCLLKTNLRETLAVLSADLVAATFLSGRCVYRAAG